MLDETTSTITVAGAMRNLDTLARELDKRSKQLHKVAEDLGPVEEEYRQFVDDFEIGLWQRSQDEDDFKLPAEKLRLKLAHKAIDQSLYGRYVGLTKSRDRLKQRIGDIKAEVDAQRSILSALKVEAEAVSHR